MAAEKTEMFRKTEAIMTPQEAEELGVSVASAKQAISRKAPTTEGGTPEPIYPAIGTLETKHPLTVPSLPSADSFAQSGHPLSGYALPRKII